MMKKVSYIGFLLSLYVANFEVGILYAASYSNFDLATNWDTYLCAENAAMVDEKTVIIVATGLTSDTLPCLALRKNLKISGKYQISSQLINVAPPIGQRNFGLVFNAIDENNYEFAYLRYYDDENCTALVHGFVEEGNIPNELATSKCLNIQTNSWNSLRLAVNQKRPDIPDLKNINAFIDEKIVGSFKGQFPTRGFGGVLAENGYNNLAEFRNFDIAPIVPNLLDEKTCIRVVTGNGAGDAGTLEFFVNNVLQSESKTFDWNEEVLDKCFANVDTISVKGLTENAWIGYIVVTKDGVEQTLECIDCSGPEFNRNICVDGDNTCYAVDYVDFTTCTNRNYCTLKIVE